MFLCRFIIKINILSDIVWIFTQNSVKEPFLFLQTGNYYKIINVHLKSFESVFRFFSYRQAEIAIISEKHREKLL